MNVAIGVGQAKHYVKTKVEALEKDFLDSKLWIRLAKLESTLLYTGEFIKHIPGDGRSI